METELIIGGMHCHHCVHAVRRALSSVEGLDVREVTIGRARVATRAGALDEERVRDVIQDEGYTLERVIPDGA